MRKFVFTKLCGAGNDFILLDKKLNRDLSLSPNDITSLCNRKNGIGADGILVIEDSDRYDFSLQYFNADGSTGSLCGNGARCSLFYAKVSGYAKGHNILFIQNGTEYSGEIIKDEVVKFNLQSPTNYKSAIKIQIDEQIFTASFIDTGSPHVVINVNDIHSFPVYRIGKEIRNHPDFLPGGVNVNFIEVIDNIIWIRTYERGVEDETLACGTGSVASALIANKHFGLSCPVKLIVKNGDQLIVEFEKSGDQFVNVSLTGPASIIFSGEITL